MSLSGDRISNRKVFNDLRLDSASQNVRETIPTVSNVSVHPVSPQGSLVYDKLTQSIWYSNGVKWLLFNTVAPGFRGALVYAPEPGAVVSITIPIAPVPIPFNAVDYDPEGLYDPMTMRFTAPADGIYSIDTNVAWEDDLVERLQLTSIINVIRNNTSLYYVTASSVFTSGPSIFNTFVSTENNIKQYLLAGDQIEIEAVAVNTAGGALPIANVLGYFTTANLRGTVASFVRIS